MGMEKQAAPGDSWPASEQQPRERLLRLGADRLSDRELLTIIIASGNAAMSAADIAEKILKYCRGQLRNLLKMHPSLPQDVKGFGKAKYCTLAAALELGRRVTLREENFGRNIQSAAQAWKQLREFIPADGCESILALLLDNRNRILSHMDISGRRHPSGTELDLRKLLSGVLHRNASGVILAHNHPSGLAKASREDVRMSRELAILLAGIGTELLDHIIITTEGYSQVEWNV